VPCPDAETTLPFTFAAFTRSAYFAARIAAEPQAAIFMCKRQMYFPLII